MGSDSDDVVSRHHNEDWDRKKGEELGKLNRKIERGFIDSARLNDEIAIKKESLRADAEETIYDDRNELLDLIAECPGFATFTTDKKFLATGVFGLKSQWYKRLSDIVLGCRDSPKQLSRLEEEVREFRETVELQISFPDEDARDRIKEPLFVTPRPWYLFDFSHLTRKTAEDLTLHLSRIETRLSVLSSTNDRLML